jgi:two-component system, cell cycle sensor histidine kinase and response regulator CckA
LSRSSILKRVTPTCIQISAFRQIGFECYRHGTLSLYAALDTRSGEVIGQTSARHTSAEPEGGEVTVETSNVTLDESYAYTHKEILSGNYVMLSVRDTGTGMTEDVKNRLFQPFFTTKRFGTGLGLATCRTIVQQSGGHIEVDTEIGRGTIFKIYLPRVEQPLEVAIEPSQLLPLTQGTKTLRRGENILSIRSKSANRILVVDDETSVRQLTTEMLIRAGFEVDAAADGAAGWQAIQTKHYDLVITDNFVPNVTGIEMVKKIHAGSMNLPVIMATAIFPQEEFQLHPWLESIPMCSSLSEPPSCCPR